MTKFKTTLIAGFIITLGAAANAQAGDNTFTVAIKQDKTISVEANYELIQKQVRAACAKESLRAGFRKTESTTGQKRKCEKEILDKVVKNSNDPYLTLVHNEAWGKKLKTTSYAQK